jgi:hypothetical protein
VQGDVFEWREGQNLIFIETFIQKETGNRLIVCRVQVQKIKRCRNFTNEHCHNDINCWHCRRLIVIQDDSCFELLVQE